MYHKNVNIRRSRGQSVSYAGPEESRTATMDLLPVKDLQHDVELLVTWLLEGSPRRKYSVDEFRERCGHGTSIETTRYWCMMQGDRPIEVDEWLLDLCGFQGPTLRHKRGNFKRLLLQNRIVFTEEPQGQQKRVIVIKQGNFMRAVSLMDHANCRAIRQLQWEYVTIIMGYSAYESKFNAFAFNEAREECQRSDDARREANEARQNTEEQMVKVNETLRMTEQRVEDHKVLLQSCFTTMKGITQAWESTITNTTIQPEKQKLRSVLVMYQIERSFGGQNKLNLVYTTRCQHYRLAVVKHQLQSRYPQSTITELVTFDPEANGTNLYIRVKTFFRRSHMGVTVSGNTINLGASVQPREFKDIVVQLRNKNAEEAEEAKRQLEKRHEDYVKLKANKASKT